MRVKCLAQEHNAMSPARARTWTVRSGVKRTNHEATLPPTQFILGPDHMIIFLVVLPTLGKEETILLLLVAHN